MGVKCGSKWESCAISTKFCEYVAPGGTNKLGNLNFGLGIILTPKMGLMGVRWGSSGGQNGKVVRFEQNFVST